MIELEVGIWSVHCNR